uniref:Uncharacterized protein n=1 Tax=Anguilla anguilla TaxID=7936 RepID=A0A0E9RHN2_ANGAN
MLQHRRLIERWTHAFFLQ